MSTKFFTNNIENTVFQKFKGIFENMKDIYAFHAVVGYFRSSGYFALSMDMAASFPSSKICKLSLFD